MPWIVVAVLAGLAGLAVAGMIMFSRRRSRIAAKRRRPLARPGYANPYGLSVKDAARLQKSAGDQMRQHQAQWSRDYLSSVTDGVLPGRIGGIPRALRVRR